MLTIQQARLIRMLDYRARYRMPTVQRDLAEALGIRRDSLNKLLARTRRALAVEGRSLAMPPRSRSGAAPLVALSDSAA
jgi:DNA-binding transcriptional regulator LsrR (DeoR family)